jgi:predicted ester cyclase
MSLEANKDVIGAYVETIFNQRQVERADELVAPDYVDHAALPGQAPGLEGAKDKWAMYLAGIPDLRVTIEELVAEGDKVTVRRSYAGTHRGDAVGYPAHRQAAPTGRHQHLPAGRREDHRAVGAAGPAGANAATRRASDAGSSATARLGRHTLNPWNHRGHEPTETTVVDRPYLERPELREALAATLAEAFRCVHRPNG